MIKVCIKKGNWNIYQIAGSGRATLVCQIPCEEASLIEIVNL